MHSHMLLNIYLHIQNSLYFFLSNIYTDHYFSYQMKRISMIFLDKINLFFDLLYIQLRYWIHILLLPVLLPILQQNHHHIPIILFYKIHLHDQDYLQILLKIFYAYFYQIVNTLTLVHLYQLVWGLLLQKLVYQYQ